MTKFDVKDLIDKGLVRAKTYTDGEYAGLSVLKYSKKVFYDNLWNTDPRLLECRGIVIDQEGNIILHPFTKIFNRGENNTDLPDDISVISVEKKNGFMAATTQYRDNFIVSTTGTLDSEYSRLARKVMKLEELTDVNAALLSQLDLLFEICDPSDPHIIDEEKGAYLIGARCKHNGMMLSEKILDSLVQLHPNCGWKRPFWERTLFSEVVRKSQSCHHEGFVVRDEDSGELLLKIKSPYYLAKKFFMRGGIKKCSLIWNRRKDNLKKSIDEEYYPLLDFIRDKYTAESWLQIPEQDRRIIIENFLGSKNCG